MILSYQRGANSQNADKIKNRANKFLNGEWKHLYDTAIDNHELKRQKAFSNHDNVQDDTEFKVRKAESLARMGNYSKAVAILTQPGLYKREDPISKIRDKHPQSDPMQLFLHPNVKNEVLENFDFEKELKYEDFYSLLRKTRSGAAPDRFGMCTKKILFVLLRDSEAHELYFVNIVIPIAQGKIYNDQFSTDLGILFLAVQKVVMM